MTRWLQLAGAIGTEIAGTLSLKAADGGAKPLWIIPVAAGYLCAFFLLARVLADGMPVGVAYGIWSAAGVALTAVLGALLFAEALTWVMGLGIALIIGGVVLVEAGHQKAQEDRRGS